MILVLIVAGVVIAGLSTTVIILAFLYNELRTDLLFWHRATDNWKALSARWRDLYEMVSRDRDALAAIVKTYEEVSNAGQD